MADATWENQEARLASVEASQLQQQHMMEELSARIEDRHQQLEERVSNVEESLVKALGNLMPKVEELLNKYQSPASSVAILNAPQLSTEDASPSGAFSTTITTSLASGPEPECYSPVPSDGESQLSHPSSFIDPTTLPKQRMSVETIAFFFCLLLALMAVKVQFSDVSPLCESHSVANSQATSDVPPSSIHEAAMWGDVAGLQRMLATGEKLDSRDKRGNTALHLAASQGCVQAVDFLISKGVMVHSSGERARTPLLCAAAGGHSETVAHLVAAGSNLNLVDAEGTTALAAATKAGHKHVVNFLLRKGANVGKADDNGETPLHHAVRGGHLALVTILLQSGASPLTTNKKMETPMYVAAKVGFAAALAEMFEISARVRIDILQECLSVAGSAQVVWVMADRVRDLVLGEAGEKALRDVAEDCRVEVLEAFLQVGVNPNARGGGGWTPLHHAAEKGHALCVRALIQADADPNLKANVIWGFNSALHLAARNGHVDCVRELLQGGADRDLFNFSGQTALQLAQENRKTGCVELLQKAGSWEHLKKKRS